MNFDLEFFLTHIFNLGPTYLLALGNTLIMAFFSMLFGVVLGLFVALARLSKTRWLRWPVNFFVWFQRGVPELVILILLYTGLAASGIFKFADITVGGMTFTAPMQAAILAFSIREGAYMGEIFRGGIMAVDHGQIEAAKALGMTKSQVLRRVTLPQAMRVVIPPTGNQVLIMIKATSLASMIGVPELLLTTQTFAAETFRIFELFIALAINYLILTTAWTMFQAIIEDRLNRHETEGTNLFSRLKARIAKNTAVVKEAA